jgi:hypothetical protein
VNASHVHTSYELELLRGAAAGEPPSRRLSRGRTAPWRQWVRARQREHQQLTVFTVDADEITAQLVHGGRR